VQYHMGVPPSSSASVGLVDSSHVQTSRVRMSTFWVCGTNAPTLEQQSARDRQSGAPESDWDCAISSPSPRGPVHRESSGREMGLKGWGLGWGLGLGFRVQDVGAHP
jgi:hypothetical protein